MKPTKHSLRIFGPALVLVLAAVLDHETLATAGSPGSVNQISPTTTGPGIKPSGTGQQQATASPASKGGTIDYGVFQFGKKIYSTGTDDVIVRIHNSQTVWPVPRGHPTPQLSPFNSGVYLMSPGPVRFIASNKQAPSTINLGKLPPGELVFGIRVDDYGCYLKTGEASRNPDGLDHVSVRTFKSGLPTELWFEDAPGPKGTGRSDRDFNDLVISVSGGVDGGAMANLVQAIKQQPKESREATIAALKKADPKMAALFTAQNNAPAK